MTRRWAAGLLTGVLVVAFSVADLSAPPRAQAAVPAHFVVLQSSNSPLPPLHATSLGSLSPTADLHVDITLKLPDPAAVRAFIASLSDRDSPAFDHFLRPGQFGQIFGPSSSEVSAVEDALRSQGLHPGRVARDRLVIPVTASSEEIDRAFHVRLVRYRLPSGRVAFTTLSPPSLQASVAGYVEGLVGLSDLVQPHNFLARAPARRIAKRAVLRPKSSSLTPRSAGPTPCQDASVASQYGGFTANQLAAYYDMTPLYSLGDFGRGVRVAVAEFEPDLPSDIAAYQACYGTSATVNYVSVDGTSSQGPGNDVEVAMDIEDVIGLAPQATIDVYQAPSASNRDVLDVYSRIVNDDTDPVVSTSWGECEPGQDASDSSFRSTEQSFFEQAATQGQTIFAAAGDDGSTDCYGDASAPNQTQLYVDDPASQPNVVGVGGTSITAGSETVWNNSAGAGGGGVSSTWCMPSYQDQSAIPGLLSSYSEPSQLVPAAGCTTGSYRRQVPDVSADADPATGYVLYWKGAWSGTSGYTFGGTSAAAPLWAAAAALIDASPFCADYGSGDAGVRPQSLYSIAALGSSSYGLALNDITTGNNDFAQSGYTGGLYPATAGYDMASGLGSPHLASPGNYYPGLAAQMCLEYRTQLVVTQITNVSPNAGPSNQPASVTITGSGFLPIAGADQLEVGGNSVTMSCSSTTSCTGTLPATGPGTVDLVMSVEDTVVSPVSSSDQFNFVGPPAITQITPAVGPAQGNTAVTIQGNDFVGAVSVQFDGRAAQAVRVISPTEITLTTPPGSGTAQVTVINVAGSSPSSAASSFTFVSPPAIAQITPDMGPTRAGTLVTIQGSNLVGDLSVFFGNRPAQGVDQVSATEVRVIAPAGSGIAQVSVDNIAGSSGASAAASYAYLPPPTITGITPAIGPQKGRTKIAIKGTNFVGSVSVRVGSVAAKAVRVISRTQISAVVPPGSGSANVVVSAVGGSSPTGPRDRYTFFAAPKVLLISPARGSSKGGTRVTIWGRNFAGAISVRFGGRLATGLRLTSPSEITVSVPPGTGTAYVLVSAVGGLSHTAPTAVFRYSSLPRRS
jgi:hypothetical protein